MSFIPGVGAIVPALVVAFASAALLALVLTPAIRRFARAFDLVDRPDARRVNLRPIPRAGGLAVAAAFLTVAIVAVILVDRRAIASVFIPASVHAPELGALLIGGVIAAAIGFLDDVLDSVPAGSSSASSPVAFVGRRRGHGRQHRQPGRDRARSCLGDAFAVAFTIVWIIGMINSINFIDGLDGLSSGISLIAAVTLGLISLTTATGAFGQPFIALLCFVLAGSLLGFLRWNFHPASIFVGTSGVMFIGYTLAVLSILGTAKVAVALLVLGVPIIDTFWIIVRRVANRKSPFTPDRGHVHHRLLDLGLSHTRDRPAHLRDHVPGSRRSRSSLSGAGQLYAFLGVVVASGVVLFVLTSRTVQEDLEAESYSNGGETSAADATDRVADPD